MSKKRKAKKAKAKKNKVKTTKAKKNKLKRRRTAKKNKPERHPDQDVGTPEPTVTDVPPGFRPFSALTQPPRLEIRHRFLASR
jgi:hypothetical protein